MFVVNLNTSIWKLDGNDCACWYIVCMEDRQGGKENVDCVDPLCGLRPWLWIRQRQWQRLLLGRWRWRWRCGCECGCGCVGTRNRTIVNVTRTCYLHYSPFALATAEWEKERANGRAKNIPTTIRCTSVVRYRCRYIVATIYFHKVHFSLVLQFH